jgi:hypothetical protein
MYKSDFDKANIIINDAKKELSKPSWFVDYNKAFNLYIEGLENYNKYLYKLNDNAVYKKSDYYECQQEMLNIYTDAINMYIKYNHKIIHYIKINNILINYLQLCNNLDISCDNNIEKFIKNDKYLPDSTHTFPKDVKDKMHKLLLDNYAIKNIK